MEISETKYESLCRNSQRLDTICDYVIDSAANKYGYMTLEIAASLLDISKEYHQAVARAKEAVEHDV